MRRILSVFILCVWASATGVWGQTVPVNGNLAVAGHINFCSTNPSGGTDAYACALDASITGLLAKTCYGYVADVANTGAASINFSSFGAKTIKKVQGGITTDLADNDIRAGQIVHVCYDGTNMQCQNCTGNAPGGTPVGSAAQVQYYNAGAFGGTSGLTVDGTTLLSMAPRITSVTATKTLDMTDGPVINCAPSTASDITLTLPSLATSSVQRRFSVIKTNATTTFGQCLVDGNGSETINGSTGTMAAATQFSRVDCDVDKTTATANWSCVAGKTQLDLSDLPPKVFTHTKGVTIDAPTTADTNKVQWYFASPVTITRVACSISGATSVTIQLDERAEATPNTAGTDVLTSALVCDADSQATTTFTNATIAARVPLNLQITAVSGTPTAVRVHVEYTLD